MPERTCPACNQRQPATAEGDKCLYCGADLPTPEEAPAEPPAPEPAAAAPPEPPPAEEPVPEGKRKCSGCGEILYATETRCWRCGLETAPPVATAPAAPPPPADQPAAPSAEPPPQVAAQYLQDLQSLPDYPSEVATAAPLAAAPDATAQSLGVWALVVGLAAWFCCPIIGSIVAIYLGVQAKNRGVTGLGMAGIILGIISLVVYLPLTILWIIGMAAGAHSTPTPEATSWLWNLPCMFS